MSWTKAQALKTGVLSMALRGSGLASRFVFTVFVAKYVGIAAVGVIGLLYGAFAVLPVAAGLGLHYRLNRDLVHLPLSEAVRRIRDRMAVSLSMCLSIVVIVLVLWKFQITPQIPYAPLVLIIGVLETIGFDIHLNFISLRRPVFANVILFLRTAAWTFPCMLLGVLVPECRSLLFILLCWFAGLLTTVLAVGVEVAKWPLAEAKTAPFDYRWAVRQFRSSLWIYFSDIAVVVSTFLDRFVVSSRFGLKDVGVFVFFWSITNGLAILVNTGLTQPTLPQLVDTARTKTRQEFVSLVGRKVGTIFALGLLISIFAYVGATVLLPRLSRPELMKFPMLFPTMILAANIRMVSDFMNYVLYAQRRDHALAAINIASVPLSAIATFSGAILGGVQGVATGLVVSSTAILLVRTAVSGLLGAPSLAEPPSEPAVP